MARKREPTIVDVFDAAEKETDPAKRADIFEAGFTTIEKPAPLVKPWFAARGEVPGNRDATTERALVMRQHDDDGSDALILAAALERDLEQLEAEIAKREKKAPRFREYYGYLRKLADGLPQR